MYDAKPLVQQVADSTDQLRLIDPPRKSGGNGAFDLDPEIAPQTKIFVGDARFVPLPPRSVDLVVTSPPYWKKRDYGGESQIGQESHPDEYIKNLVKALRDWRRVLRKTGSVFINVGDTYWKKRLAGIPALLELAVAQDGWIVRNRIIWAKGGGMPEPARDRLANRHEFIFHLVKDFEYYYDIFGYSQKFGNGANPGDIWPIDLVRNGSSHLAPFPPELVERSVFLACPPAVCYECNQPVRRIVRRTARLDPKRPQAKRAMEIAQEAKLTAAHIRAIQATGISDAGKARRVQTGTDRNAAEVRRLAKEAKEALGGYFREFTFAKKESVGWDRCECDAPLAPGVVLDPFVGTGTTVNVAKSLGLSAFGVDINTWHKRDR